MKRRKNINQKCEIVLMEQNIELLCPITLSKWKKMAKPSDTECVRHLRIKHYQYQIR